MQKIYYKKELLAIKIDLLPKGSTPLTDPTFPLQIVALAHPKGKILAAHMHEPKKRTTPYLQECLVVKKGKIKVELYTREKKKFKKVFLKEGQALLMINCGVGITVMQDCEVMEFKNGPFVEDKVLI